MPNFVDITTGKTPAEASDIQQVIDALTARRNTPLSVLTNDPINFSLTLKNTDAGGKGLIIYGPDGSTVLLQVDDAGVKISPDGTAAVTPVTEIGPGADQAAEGDHTHGTGGYSGTGSVTLENLFAETWHTTAVNYVVEDDVLFVFCTSGVQVTLGDAATVNRPIWVIAITGQSTVVATGGSVVGGSVNVTTGAVQNGVVNQGDSIGYKADGTNWRAAV